MRKQLVKCCHSLADRLGAKSRRRVFTLQLWVLLALIGGWVVYAGEQVSVAFGRLQVVEPGFVVTGVRVANQGVVQIERLGNDRLSIHGRAVGQSDVQVIGENGEDKTYSISVVPDNEELLRAVRRDLDGVHEVDVYENLGRIVLKGEVNNPRNWSLVKKVAEAYGGQILNLASFVIGPSVILNLQKALETDGFVVVTDGSQVSRLTPNTLLLLGDQDGVKISGSVYSKKQREQINRVVSGQPYLVIADGQQQVKEGQLPAVVDVNIEPVMLELDVYFAVLRDSDMKQVGTNLLGNGLITINAAADLLSGVIGRNESSGPNGSYIIKSSMSGTLQYFQAIGPSQTFSAGHLSFKNYAEDWKKLHSGGTLKVKVTSSENAALVDIDYGLIIKTKGGLLDQDTADLELNLELSNPILKNGDYDVKRDVIESAVQCPLGNTLVMGGVEQYMENIDIDGTPLLREVPVIKYFFSKKTQQNEKLRMLILISPQLAPSAVAASPVSERTQGTVEQAQQPLQQDRHGK